MRVSSYLADALSLASLSKYSLGRCSNPNQAHDVDAGSLRKARRFLISRHLHVLYLDLLEIANFEAIPIAKDAKQKMMLLLESYGNCLHLS